MAGTRKTWVELIKPYKVVFERESSITHTGKMVVEPLEKGFGITLGNAMRRVLLSSIPGAAVTAVRIPGVVSEFSTVVGVREDVIDILLNLKGLHLELLGTERQSFTIKAKGPCEVTGALLEGLGDVKILNPDHVICTLGDGVEFQMEMTVALGRGYVATPSSEEKRSVDEILLDAHYNPVKRVSFEVEKARVGQSTDYDRLILRVETNGTITPEGAIQAAAEIIQKQLHPFFSPRQETNAQAQESREVGALSASEIAPIFFKNVEALDLNQRCKNCLKLEGIVYVGDLVTKTNQELLRTPNFGVKSLQDISEALSRFSLSLGMTLPGWPPQDLEAHEASSPTLETPSLGNAS